MEWSIVWGCGLVRGMCAGCDGGGWWRVVAGEERVGLFVCLIHCGERRRGGEELGMEWNGMEGGWVR